MINFDDLINNGAYGIVCKNRYEADKLCFECNKKDITSGHRGESLIHNSNWEHWKRNTVYNISSYRLFYKASYHTNYHKLIQFSEIDFTNSQSCQRVPLTLSSRRIDPYYDPNPEYLGLPF